jgi:hypothetical protein
MSLVGKFLSGAGKVNRKARRLGGNLLDARDNAIIGSMVKKTEANFTNGYTGLAPTKAMTVAGIGVVGAYAYGQSLQVHTKPNPGTIEYAQQSPIMAGDGGMGATGRAPNLGASGSLVFGLNAMRRG